MNRRTPATVLLLEGQQAARAAYGDALRAAGLEVTEADNSDAMRRALLTAQPRIIVVGFDAQTRADRLRFCRELKDDPRTHVVPTLLIADEMTAEDVGLATDLGVLVVKVPHYDAAKLVAAINGMLAVQRTEPLRAALRQRQDRSA